MTVLALKDGTSEIIYDDKDFRDLVDRELGADAARWFDTFVSEKNGTPINVGDNYEAIADSYRNFIVDIMNSLHDIISQKRLNRYRLEELYNYIYNNM